MKTRNRFVKPEFLKHGLLFDVEQRSQLPIRLAFLGVWMLCDREGRFEWKPREIKADIFPYEGSVESMAAILEHLRANGFVVQYTVGGRVYGWVPRFKVHQYINPQEAASKLPPPPPDVVRQWESDELRRQFGDMTPSSAGTAGIESRQPDATDAAPARQTSEFGFAGSGQPAGEFDGVSDDAGRKLSGVDSVSSSNDSELPNGSRVDGASIARDLRDFGACIPEPKTRTEQNRTEEERTSTALVVARPDEGNARALPAVRGKKTGDAVLRRFVAVLDEITAGTRTRLAAQQRRTLQAELVFSYWQRTFNHPRALLDRDREAIIAKRLEENNGDVSELLYALDGATRDGWVMGTDARANHPNDAVPSLLRNRARVEQYANVCKAYRDGKPHPTAAKYGAVMLEATTGGQLAIENGDGEPHGQHDQQHDAGTAIEFVAAGPE